MNLPRSSTALPRVEWRERSSSTNAELRELVEREGDAVPHGTVLATVQQTAGRGRLGRGWEMPPGTGLAMSMLIRSGGGSAPTSLDISWLPLLAGSAVSAALQPFFSELTERALENGDEVPETRRVGVKWPNDVHVRDEHDAEHNSPGKKLCGILCEMLPNGDVIVGMGVNLFIAEWDLPTERSTSLLAAGAYLGEDIYEGDEFSFGEPGISAFDPRGAAILDRVMSEIGTGLLALVARSKSEAQGVRIRAARDSVTLGSEVRVHLPGGEIVDGRAVRLADDGALVVDRPTGKQLIVHAGDVEHLR